MTHPTIDRWGAQPANLGVPASQPDLWGNTEPIPPTRPRQSGRALQAVRPVKPCAVLLTIGVALGFAGNFLIGFGMEQWDGATAILTGSVTALAGYIVGIVGVYRFLAQRDREYQAKGICRARR